VNKKIIFIGIFLTATTCAVQAFNEISTAIKCSNADKVRVLLEKVNITQEQKNEFIQMAQEQSRQAKQQLDKTPVDMRDAASLSAGTAGVYCSAASLVCALFGTFAFLAEVLEGNFDYQPALFGLAGAVGTGVYGYFGGTQLLKGLTKNNRKKKLVNALAIENIIQSVKPQ
jgi:hypothetical protein